MAKFIKIHENDNVAVALETIAQGETITHTRKCSAEAVCSRSLSEPPSAPAKRLQILQQRLRINF